MSSTNALNIPTKNETDFFKFYDYHVEFFSDPETFVYHHRWPPDAVCTFVTLHVYFILISRLWHSEGRAAQTEHVNIWASLFWARDMFSLPSMRVWRSSAGISPSSLRYLTGDLLCVVTVLEMEVNPSSSFWKANSTFYALFGLLHLESNSSRMSGAKIVHCWPQDIWVFPCQLITWVDRCVVTGKKMSIAKRLPEQGFANHSISTWIRNIHPVRLLLFPNCGLHVSVLRTIHSILGVLVFLRVVQVLLAYNLH